MFYSLLLVLLSAPEIAYRGALACKTIGMLSSDGWRDDCGVSTLPDIVNELNVAA